MIGPESTLFELERELILKCEAHYHAGVAWAAAKAEYEHLEDLKKQVKANQLPEEGPQYLREAEAERSNEYTLHLNAIKLARLDFLKKDVKYQSLKLYIEALRSVISNRREMINKGIDA